MTESDRKFYERKERQDKKRKRSLSKARNRGNVAEDWFKTNKLTPETKPEFDALMKKADREFEKGL